ncbi:MAG TPA: hypothetical protein VGC76_13695 [Pyrinomonadaceae bacterium]|jgi:hypothetical protein
MLKKSLFAAFIVLAFVSFSLAQKVYTPAKDSAERKAILGALRVPVEKELKQKVQFSVDNFNVQSNWAFVGGAPQNMSGGAPNFKGTDYQKRIDVDAFDNNIFALLKKTGGRWKVVTYMIGCTDVCYLNWTKDYKAPKKIFPGAE